MLYIMRHGKTEWNLLRKLQGRTDIPLSNEGRMMAAAAHDEYLGVHLDICFSSPLVRARETAEIMLKDRDIPIITDSRLMEMSFGSYEGITDYFQASDSPINVLFREPASYIGSVGGSETFEELFARTGAFLNEAALPAVAAGKDVLIVGHGAMNSAIICQIKQLDIADFWSSGLAQCKIMRLI